MGKLKVVQYINQFFAQVGGEDKADYPMEYHEGAMARDLLSSRLSVMRLKSLEPSFAEIATSERIPTR